MGARGALVDEAGLRGHDLILVGHSMGGNLALRYAVWRADDVKAVILSAPMMAPPVMPVWLIRVASYLLSNIGLAKRYPPFHHVLSLDVSRHYRVEDTLTRDPGGYEEQFVWFADAPGVRRRGRGRGGGAAMRPA